MKLFDKEEFELGYGSRFQRFQDLMRYRVREILLVSSLYDSFILSEDGRLYEELLTEYIGLNLTHMPGITRVSSGHDAIEMVKDLKRFDLIITTRRLEDMHAVAFAEGLRREKIDIPLVLLTYDNRELQELMEHHDLSRFERVFMWQGDFRILLSIIKYIEDKMNVDYDTHLVGVQSIILIEDNVRFYSSYLPMIYTEVMKHTQRLISEGVNPAHKLLRQRARPKILLSDNYEEAWNYFQRYHDNVLGVISDIQFPRGGVSDPEAGFEFAKSVKAMHPDIPVLLQSRDIKNKERAEATGASFLLKNSPMLLHELQRFMKENFSFGDFIFRLPDGTEVGRAKDLKSLEEQLHRVPVESLIYHGERNHFSNWLKARTEFWLAHKLRPRKVSDYASGEELRNELINSLHDLRVEQHRGIVMDYDPKTMEEATSVVRIGGGSLGGKGRGVAFCSTLINTYRIQNEFPGVKISVPSSIILSTDVFHRFLDENKLHDFAIRTDDDEEITRRFVEAELPHEVVRSLKRFIKSFRFPLSVRSSSLLEDSQFIPFAGVYKTFMIPNNHKDYKVRLEQLLSAVKRVYASTFFKHAKTYFKPTPYRLEEEMMAVMVQKLVGVRHGSRFYPDFSGVARSHNFYPMPPMKAADGIASVALGLGKTVVEGGRTLRFCPRYPKHVHQLSTVEFALGYSQMDFWALELPPEDAAFDPCEEFELAKFGLDVAEKDGVLAALGSTYSRENHAIYDGISRNGVRIVSFAPILKGDLFPLARILELLLALGQKGMNTPVEIEFAVNLTVPPGEPKEFHLLQMRPMVINDEVEKIEIEESLSGEIICRSSCVLGNGVVDDIRDIVMVHPGRFKRSESPIAAKEVGFFNHKLAGEGRPYLLIGVGRWGSADPWLGIPVTWDDIWGARVIVECGMKDLKVTPSQGAHFFQNITAARIGYFTIDSEDKDSYVNWSWLASHGLVEEKKFTCHISLEDPLVVVMNGHDGEGVIYLPAGGRASRFNPSQSS